MIQILEIARYSSGLNLPSALISRENPHFWTDTSLQCVWVTYCDISIHIDMLYLIRLTQKSDNVKHRFWLQSYSTLPNVTNDKWQHSQARITKHSGLSETACCRWPNGGNAIFAKCRPETADRHFPQQATVLGKAIPIIREKMAAGNYDVDHGHRL